MSTVFNTIAERLNNLTPKIDITQYIKTHHGKSTLDEKSTTLDGIYFEPKNVDGTVGYRDLYVALIDAKDSNGKRAFAGNRHEDIKHWGLKLSLIATQGVGLREIWRIPPLPELKLTNSFGNSEKIQINESAAFSSQFGSLPNVTDISSLHVGMTRDECNIHIDVAGFTIEHQNNISLTPDFVQHTADELLLKTFVKGLAPDWIAALINRISFIYPNVNNHYTRTGPSSGQLLGWSKKIPVIGSHLGGIVLPGISSKIPLPGIEIDLIKQDMFKIKITASCSVFGEKGCPKTIAISGLW